MPKGGGLPEGSGLDRPRELAFRTPSRPGFPDGPDIAVGERSQPSCGRTADSMPRQRTQYRRRTYDFPGDFPERLKRFKEESGLSWSEIAAASGPIATPYGVGLKTYSPIQTPLITNTDQAFTPAALSGGRLVLPVMRVRRLAHSSQLHSRAERSMRPRGLLRVVGGRAAHA